VPTQIVCFFLDRISDTSHQSKSSAQRNRS
jgi:hypothetical protein